MQIESLRDIIAEKAEEIAKILNNNNDCELRKSPSGISIIELKKKVIQ